MHLAGEDRDKYEPISDPSAKSTCDPHENNGRAKHIRIANLATFKDDQAGAEHMESEKDTVMAGSPQNRQCTNHVYPHSRDSVAREENTT